MIVVLRVTSNNSDSGVTATMVMSRRSVNLTTLFLGRLRPKRLAEALLSGMRALHRAREGQKVVLLNDSERSLNLFFFFFFFFSIYVSSLLWT